MGRPVKNTIYREHFAGKKLNEKLKEATSSTGLRRLYEAYISEAENERNNRLLNNSDIVKQLVKFINVIENKVTVDTDIVDIISYKDLYFKIKDKIRSLENQGKGGVRASATRKANKEKAVFIVTYDTDYANGTYKTKAVNEKNEQLFTDYSEGVEAIQNYDSQNNLWYEKTC